MLKSSTSGSKRSSGRKPLRLNPAIIARTTSTFLLRRRLLLKPHGFEGLVLVHEDAPKDDLSLADREDMGELRFHRDRRLLASAPVQHRHDDLVADVTYTEDVDAVIVPLLRP